MKKKLKADEVLKEVNKFDKEFGVKLRNPKIWKEPSQYKESYIADSEMELSSVIATLNDVDLREYYNDDFLEANKGVLFPVDVHDERFTELSKLDWNDKETTYWTDSVIFKSRFLSLVLSRFLGKLSKLTERRLGDKYLFEHSKDEQIILYVNEIMRDCYKFINCLFNDTYKNIILKIHLHLSYTSKKINRKKLYVRLNNMIIDTRKNLKHKLFKPVFLDDDVCINNILQIAYILTTDDYEGNHGVPKFKHIEGATRYHDLRLLIEKLGKRIIMNTGKYSVMFRAFTKARPKVYCEFKEVNENACLRMGVLALEYTRFVMNDKYADKFIREMLKEGK